MRGDIKDKIEFLGKENLDLCNKTELARRFDCDSRTIDRYIKISKGEILPKTSRRVYTSKLDDYKEIIIDKVDKFGCTAMSVYKFIQGKGYSGKYSIVADFVRQHKATETKKATIRYETNPGLQAQVDWKEDMKLVNRKGEVYVVNIFLMVLGYSRYKYLAITSDRSQETLFDCMTSAFKHFGGVPREILFDNMKTVVDQSRSSFTRTVFNQKFEYYAKDIGFKPVACQPYRPQTKGKVEAMAKLVERLRAYNEEFYTWNDLVNISRNFMDDINEDVSQGSGLIPAEELKKEKEYFLPLPYISVLEKYISRQEDSKTYLVNRESMIRYEGRKYSVPIRYIGKRMTVNVHDGNLEIYYSGKLVVCHVISDKMFNYTVGTACDILKSDAMKHKTDEEIMAFVQENLLSMDKWTGGL